MRPDVPAALAGVDLIIHAGDIGAPPILEALRAIAPTIAIRGNVDTHPAFSMLAETQIVFAAPDVQLYVLHDLAAMRIDPAAAGYRAVISGHSHRPKIEERQGVLYLNPGAAGPRRFHLRPSLALVEVRGRDLLPTLIHLSE